MNKEAKVVINKRNGGRIAGLAAMLAVLVFCLTGCGITVNRTYYDLEYSESNEYIMALTNNVIYSCVEIQAGSSVGSGVIIRKEDKGLNTSFYILTNRHVISQGEEPDSALVSYRNISVYFFDNTVSYKINNDIVANVKLGGGAVTDLAVFSVSMISTYAELYDPVEASVDALAYGQRILAIGNGLGYGTSVCDGLVSNPSYKIERKTGSVTTYSGNMIQISAPINPGNSGGALFDMKGRLVGINTLKAAHAGAGEHVYADNISFSVPIATVQSFLNQNGIAAYLTVDYGTESGD